MLVTIFAGHLRHQHRLAHQQGRRGRQIIEQTGLDLLGGKKRRQQRAALEALVEAQTFDELLPFEAGFVAEHADVLGIEPGQDLRQATIGVFVGGADGDALERVGTALGDGIKQAQAVDFVTKKLDPQWLGRLQRENIDNPAAPIEVAGLAHRRTRAVAHRLPAPQQLERVEALPQCNGHTSGLQIGRRQGRLQQGPHRGNYQRRRGGLL